MNKSLNGNIWKIKEADERKAELISQRYDLPFIVSKILCLRNIPAEEVITFLEPKIQALLPNPSILKDMDKTAEKLSETIINNKKIAIIGDYDVDGATSSAVLKLYFEKLGLNVPVHIPNRDEGYGPSNIAFDKFSALGISLVITVDCGTSAFEPIDYAVKKGIEVIIIDHHEAEIKLPNAYSIVNPKRLDEEDHPYLKYMAAVGVAFVTIVALNRVLREKGFFNNKPEPNLMQFLDLVALGTVCDVVPLLGLNRAFVKQGLKIMAKRENIGLKSLIDVSGINEAPTPFHLGYVLGPRINAGGRVGDSCLANKLLCTKNEEEAKEIALELNKFNDSRKEIEAYVLLKAIEILEGENQEYPIAFVYGSDWHQGVIGIVAGKLKERYNLPSFVMSIEGGDVKGSSRSIPGLDLGALIISAKEKGILTKGGGHSMAAGFSLNEDKIDEFRRFVGEYVKEKIGSDAIAPTIEIDGVIDIMGANLELIEKLEMLEPYGAGNAEPKIMIKNIKANKSCIRGSGHISCFLGGIKAMAFRSADTNLGKALLESKGEVFNLVGTLRRDNWQGRNQVQFIIEDGEIA